AAGLAGTRTAALGRSLRSGEPGWSGRRCWAGAAELDSLARSGPALGAAARCSAVLGGSPLGSGPALAGRRGPRKSRRCAGSPPPRIALARPLGPARAVPRLVRWDPVLVRLAGS